MKIFVFPIVSRTKDIIWEHILMSVMGFIGAYALLFFNTEGTILSYATLKFSISIGAVILSNLYVIYKNARRNQLIELNYDEAEQRLYFSLISQYSSQIVRKSIILQEVILERTGNKNIVFSTKKQSGFAVIKPKENLWIYQRKEFAQGLAKLKELLPFSRRVSA